MVETVPTGARTHTVGREWGWFFSAFLGIGLLLAYSLYANQREIDALERDRLRVQAKVVADNLGRQLEGVNNALEGVRDEILLLNPTSLAQTVSPRLKALNDAMPGIRSMHVLDAQGRVTATSREPATVGRSFAERELFTIPRERPDATTLYVSPPYTSRREQVFTVNMGRALVDAKGAFTGVVTAALDPEYFEVLLGSVLYAPDMRTALLHGDGTLFLYVPPTERGTGVDRSKRSSFFTRHRDSGQVESVLVGTSTSSGNNRLMVMRTIRRGGPQMDRPLIVAVSRETAAIYLPWRREAALRGGLYLLFGTAAGLALYLKQRRQQRLERLALAQESERSEIAQRLELALAGADLGLWDWQLPSGDVVFDQRWCTMLGYELGEIEPAFESWRRLVHPDDLPKVQAALAAHLKGDTPLYEFEHRLRHKGGEWRWILTRGKVVQRDESGKPVRVVGTHMDISARKSADAALHEAHVFAQQVIDSLPHGFAVRDAELRYRHWNPVMEQLTGLPAERVIGRKSAEVLADLAPPLLDALVQSLQRALAGEIVVSADRFIERPDRVYWTTAIHGPLRDSAGKVIGTISSVQDITDRKLAEQQLQRSEEDLAVTLQSIGDAVIATDAAGRIARMNSSAERLTGWTLKAAKGRPLAEVFRIVNAETRRTVPNPVHLVLERGETVGLANHTALISGNGVEYQIADTAAPIRDASGSITGVVLVFSDVTAQYRTQQALKDSERRFRTIFEAGPQCIKILDGQGRFVDVNAAGLVVFEAESTPDLQQHLLLDLVLPEYRDALSALLRRVLTGENGVLEFEITGLKGTQRWLEGHAATLRDALGNVTVLVIAGDVTRRKKAQAERRALEAQLRESQKMEAMGTLAGGIAHDFNNILGAILGNTALARQDIREDHPAWQSLEQINRAGLRARELVRQILAFSRRQPHNLVTQPIQPLVVETLALLRATLPAMVKLDTEIAQEALHVHADTTQIEQVIMNLCTNAWHALQGSTGHIVVGIGPAVLDDAAARTLRAAAPGPYVHLWVSDNGSGMDAATQARIFEPFFTTKPTGQGTGLGLSVVHGIVGAHRGAIAVESSPGKGSTFHVYLPLVDGIDFAPSIAVELKASAGRGQHVAYVDDDEVMVLMVERILQRQGYRVTGFLDAKMAIAAVRAQPDGFDLIVTDFNMPEISGLDVASEMGSIRADLPVVISSGYISDELRAGAHRLGVRALLQKQNTSEELGALVYSILVTHGS